MSNHLAIATVTATLQRTLQNAIQMDVEGGQVTTLKPGNIGNGTPEKGVNLFLYQVALNPLRQNTSELRFRNRKGEAAKKSRTALDLHYMISFYGNDNNLEPQRLMGSVVRALTDSAMVTAEMLRYTIRDSSFSYLSTSDLMEQIEEIQFTPLDLSLEDLSKAWSVFFQAPYNLSVAYQASVIMIEGDRTGSKPLPVRQPNTTFLGTFPNQPHIQQVTAANDRYDYIFANSEIRIVGKYLDHGQTQVRLNDLVVAPKAIAKDEIIVDLKTLPRYALQAGIMGTRVVHGGGQGKLGAPGSLAIESNVFPVVLRPQIVQVDYQNQEGEGQEMREGALHITLDLTVGETQKAIVALNEWSVAQPENYLFAVPPRTENSANLTVPIRGVKPGQYLIRVQVDGAESALQSDDDPQSPSYGWYVGPRVVII